MLTNHVFKGIVVTVLFLFFAGITAGCSGKSSESVNRSAQDKVLYMGTQNDYPPFTFIAENGALTGLDIEFVQELEKRLNGYKIEILPLGWDSSFIALESRRIQFIVDQVAITPERLEKYTFSIPYFTAGSAIIVKKGRTDIKTLDDLQGKRVGAFAGDSYSQILENYNAAHGANEQIILIYTSGTTLDRLQDVAIGRIDAAVDDPVMTNVSINELGLGIDIVGELIQTEPMGVLFSKNEEGQQLKAQFDPIIQQMIDDGTIKNLSQKWLNADFSPH